MRFGIAGRRDGFLTRLQAGPLMVRAYLSVRATGGAVFFPMRGENTRERWSPFKGEGDGGCSKIQKKNFWIFFWYFAHLIVSLNLDKVEIRLHLGKTQIKFGFSLNLDKFLTLKNENIFPFSLLNRNFALILRNELTRFKDYG